MDKPILLLDIDDTIADSTKHFAKCFEEHYKIPATKENGFYMFSDKMIWLFNHTDMLWDIPIKQDFFAIWRELDTLFDIIFISNRGMWDGDFISESTDGWLLNQLNYSRGIVRLYISDNLDHKLELIKQIDWQIYVDDDQELLNKLTWYLAIDKRYSGKMFFNVTHFKNWQDLSGILKNAIK